MKKDYSELKGTQVELVLPRRLGGTETLQAVVAGAHYDHGITLVLLESEREILCLNRKLHSPDLYKGKKRYYRKVSVWSYADYRRAFQGLIKLIKAGRVDAMAYVDAYTPLTRGTLRYGTPTCAFK